MKNDRDNYLLHRWRQDTKKGKDSKKWKSSRQLLAVLCLLIIVGYLFIIIVVGRSTRGAYAKSG
jgi:cytoskeletal protein RodZ